MKKPGRQCRLIGMAAGCESRAMSHLSRRRFLTVCAATFGATAVGSQWSPIPGLAQAATPPAGTVTTIPTFCEMCFWRCGGIAHVRDGKLWKFEGNPKDPQSQGRLCPRGTGAVGAHYDPDRIRQPLLRVGERGKEEWKAVSWDEALGHIAERFAKIKAEHGAESIALFNHGFGQRFIQHVLKSYGVINYAGPVVRAVPRRARRRLPADIRQRRRLARADRHPRHRLPGADRLAPGREHAQLAGAGVRPGDRAARAGDRGRPALLRRGEQGQVLASGQTRHRSGAAAGMDEPARQRRPLRQGLRREARPWLRASSRPRSRATRWNGRPKRRACRPN